MFYPHDEFCVHRMSTKHAVIWVLERKLPTTECYTAIFEITQQQEF